MKGITSSSLIQPQIIIRDTQAVDLKLNRIFQAGAHNLHLIADYDSTLTKHFVNGKRNIISHAVLTLSDKISEEFKVKCASLDKKYFPMQSSELLSFDEKYLKMTECWNLYNQAYIDEKISRKSLKAALDGISLKYRVGTDALFEICEKKSLPLLIFSAGVTDVIEVLLEASGLMKPHVHVLSNAMVYSHEEPNLCIAFTSPPIHILNKGETPVSETPHHGLIASRKNIILLGDSLGDLQMSKTIPHDTILTIGFLNHDVEKNLDVYTKSYDIVIIDDSDFGPVNKILSELQ